MLARSDSGESDRRVVLLTKELGITEAIARGARKAGSRLAGCTEPLTHASFQLAPGRVRTFITQAQVHRIHAPLRTDLDRLLCALALAEAFASLLPKGQEQPEALELLLESIEAISTHAEPVTALVWSELRLLDMEGSLPSFERCVITDRPIRGNAAWFSPMAGGMVSADAAHEFRDRFLISDKARIGLMKTAALSESPPHLAPRVECLGALYRLLLGLAERRLPSSEALLASLGLSEA